MLDDGLYSDAVYYGLWIFIGLTLGACLILEYLDENKD